MIRTVSGIEYTFVRKKIKNINLRVKENGSVYLSAPYGASTKKADEFVLSKKTWIENAKSKACHRKIADSSKTDAECLDIFEKCSSNVFPAFSKILLRKPEIKVKLLKSAWGICHFNKGYITLNRALADKDEAAIEYVVLHEYVHFLHHDHSSRFYDELKKHMPDYIQRKKLLK